MQPIAQVVVNSFYVRLLVILGKKSLRSPGRIGLSHLYHLPYLLGTTALDDTQAFVGNTQALVQGLKGLPRFTEPEFRAGEGY